MEVRQTSEGLDIKKEFDQGSTNTDSNPQGSTNSGANPDACHGIDIEKFLEVESQYNTRFGATRKAFRIVSDQLKSLSQQFGNFINILRAVNHETMVIKEVLREQGYTDEDFDKVRNKLKEDNEQDYEKE